MPCAPSAFVSAQARYAGAMRYLVLPVVLLALAACSKQENAPGPGGVSVGEAKALDEAAEMVEHQRLPDEDMPLPTRPATQQAAPNRK